MFIVSEYLLLIDHLAFCFTVGLIILIIFYYFEWNIIFIMKRTGIAVLFLMIASPFNPLQSQEESAVIDSTSIKQEINYMLIAYCDSGDINTVKLLLNHGADPNTTTAEGVTPLMYASQNGYYSIASLLLDNGADPNKIPFDGNTALHAVARAGNDSIAELLMINGANVNLSNNFGLTPLHYTVWLGYPYLTDLLLYYGAKVDVSDVYGYTPLMLSVYSGTSLSTRLLLEQGANPSLCSKRGVSPLMVAAQFNDTLLAHQLLEYNADVFLKDTFGANALALAINSDSREMIDFLLDNGAAEQKLSKSYYQLAAETEYRDMVSQLDSAGLKTTLKFSLGNVIVSPGILFGSHEFMWGGSVGVKEMISKITVSLGYWYRPWPVSTFKYQESTAFKYKEDRQIVELKANKSMNILPFSSGKSVNFYFGANIDLVFRDYNGDTPTGSKTGLYPGLNIGLSYGGSKTRLTAGWEFTWLRTPNVSPHRVGVRLDFYIPVGHPKLVKTVINHVY